MPPITARAAMAISPSRRGHGRGSRSSPWLRMSPSIAHPQDHADQDHVDPHQLRYVGAARMVHAGRRGRHPGGPRQAASRRGTGRKSGGPPAVVDELDTAVAVLEPETVRLRVEPVDAG